MRRFHRALAHGGDAQNFPFAALIHRHSHYHGATDGGRREIIDLLPDREAATVKATIDATSDKEGLMLRSVCLTGGLPSGWSSIFV